MVAMQLSEVQQGFVQFCSLLQELILNQQVAHSVVSSLHDDLPAMQPDAGAKDNTSGSAGTRPDPASERLHLLAPRLTPTLRTFGAVPGVGPSGAGSRGDPPNLLACEVQDNYIILQNAAFKARGLLEGLQKLQQAAAAAAVEMAASAAPAPAPVAIGDACATTAAAAGGAVRELGHLLSDKLRLEASVGANESASCGDSKPAASDAPFDVDVEVVLDATTAMQWIGEGTDVEGTASEADDAGIATTAGGGGAPATPTPGGHSFSGAKTPPAHAFGAVTASAAAGAAAVGAAVAGDVRRPAALSGPELSLLMRELCREAALEVEMLGSVASAVELSTPAEDLYVYGMMLKLQPYLDERVVAAALVQKNVLAPPPPPPAAPAGGKAGAKGGHPGGRR